MVSQAIDTRRHAANVYCSPDGRQWVLREDYESLMAKATLTHEEFSAAASMCSVVSGLLDRADGLEDHERAAVARWLALFSQMMLRLAG